MSPPRASPREKIHPFHSYRNFCVTALALARRSGCFAQAKLSAEENAASQRRADEWIAARLMKK